MTWLIAAVLLADPQMAAVQAAPNVCEVVAAEVQTGSLLLSRGDCLAVRVYTKSSYTHVGAVVLRDGKPYVYDSMNGKGVRCLPLADYLEHQTPCELHLFHPCKAFSPQRVEKFEWYLESQRGRPYAFKHHVTGQRANGIHCSEYVTDALIACDVVRADQPARVSPASLVAGITRHDLYKTGSRFELAIAEPVSDRTQQSWCSRTWEDTKRCTSKCFSKLTALFCCK